MESMKNPVRFKLIQCMTDSLTVVRNLTKNRKYTAIFPPDGSFKIIIRSVISQHTVLL